MMGLFVEISTNIFTNTWCAFFKKFTKKKKQLSSLKPLRIKSEIVISLQS